VGQFAAPFGIAVDENENVYVTDQGNNRVDKFTADGVPLAQWGTLGTGAGQLYSPYGIASSRYGGLYVCDTNFKIQEFLADSTFVTQWGSIGTDNGQFYSAAGVAVDQGGNVYVSDASADRVQVFSSAGEYITQWGPWGLGTASSSNRTESQPTSRATSLCSTR